MDDWQVGDLALCVKLADERCAEAFDPRLGSISIVREVLDSFDLYDGHDTLGLNFKGICPTTAYCYNSAGFRRIAPLSDSERREALEDLKLPERVS